MPYPHAAWPAPEAITRLIADAQRGPARRVDALLATLRPPLVAFFAAHLATDAAEDLAQVALLRIAHALPTIEPERADKFVVTVARNLLRTAYRRRARDGRRWAPPGAADDVAAASAADVHAEYEDLARAVHRVAAADLPPTLRAVVLGLLRNETPAEIAERLGISPVTVRTRLMRARAVLRRELRPYLDRHAPERHDRAG